MVSLCVRFHITSLLHIQSGPSLDTLLCYFNGSLPYGILSPSAFP